MSDNETQRHQEALAIEAKDDEQIMEELKGRIVEEYFYEFKLKLKDGSERQVTGISWAGIKQLARVQGNVRVSRPEIQETDEHFRVVCSAEDPSRNVVMWGAAQQPKKILKDGSEIEDNFALTKCLSKGQRNAIRALFPETIIKHAYEMWKAKKVPPPQPVKEVPPKEPVATPAAGATREELEELLDSEFKEGTLQLVGKEDHFEIVIINPIDGKKHKEIGQLLAHYGGRYTPEGGRLFWTVPAKKTEGDLR